MKFCFIQENASEYPVKRMCQVLGVDESSYYKWRKRLPSKHHLQDEALVEEIQEIYEDNWQTYGSPRIHVELRDRGLRCSRKRVARLMREQGLCVKSKRRRVVTTDSRHSDPVAPNLLKQEFEAAEPNQKWLTDITAIWTAEGWLYLAAILDVCSRRVVGWSMSEQRDEQLVRSAFQMAVTSRRPKGGLLHHSDRGSQYTSLGYQELLKQHEIQISMSRKGNCYDNAMMESFFGTLKEEWVERHRFETRREARTAVFSYIVTFYNRKRRHSSLGYVSPLAFEERELWRKTKESLQYV
jgi:transposase InsO family protein